MKNVTIIVPVYQDWDSLNVCLNSLIKYVEPRHQILIVNDKAPDWENMERKILKTIQGCPNFHYFLNPKNLGFVQTCNRAVFELDVTGNDIMLLNSDTRVTEGFLQELQQVLDAGKNHGVVCPRSNHATILTTPFWHSMDQPLDEAVSYKVFLQMKQILPRYTVIPTGVGFAFLIRRSLVDAYGLFDEIYSPGYGEENDFCMRIRCHGYQSVMANRAYVFHEESRSFGKKRDAIAKAHHKILLGRYPSYDALVQNYLYKQMHPVEHFADVVADGVYQKKKVLFSLYELSVSQRRRWKYARQVYEDFCRKYGSEYEIHLLVTKAADVCFGVSASYEQVWHPKELVGHFHLALVPFPVYDRRHLCLLNRVCLEYAFCIQYKKRWGGQALPAESCQASVCRKNAICFKSMKYCKGVFYASQIGVLMEDVRRKKADVSLLVKRWTDLCGIEAESCGRARIFFRRVKRFLRRICMCRYL